MWPISWPCILKVLQDANPTFLFWLKFRMIGCHLFSFFEKCWLTSLLLRGAVSDNTMSPLHHHRQLLYRMVLTMLRSQRYSFLQMTCRMLLRVAGEFLLAVVCMQEVARPDLHFTTSRPLLSSAAGSMPYPCGQSAGYNGRYCGPTGY